MGLVQPGVSREHERRVQTHPQVIGDRGPQVVDGVVDVADQLGHGEAPRRMRVLVGDPLEEGILVVEVGVADESVGQLRIDVRIHPVIENHVALVGDGHDPDVARIAVFLLRLPLGQNRAGLLVNELLLQDLGKGRVVADPDLDHEAVVLKGRATVGTGMLDRSVVAGGVDRVLARPGRNDAVLFTLLSKNGIGVLGPDPFHAVFLFYDTDRLGILVNHIRGIVGVLVVAGGL